MPRLKTTAAVEVQASKVAFKGGCYMSAPLALKALRADSAQDVCPHCLPIMQAKIDAVRVAQQSEADKQAAELSSMIAGIEDRLVNLIGQIEDSIERVNADVLRAVLPSFTVPSTLCALGEALRSELKRDPAGEIEIVIHPRNARVRDWAGKLNKLPVVVNFDESLKTLECRVRWVDGERIIDAEGVVAACLNILEAET